MNCRAFIQFRMKCRDELFVLLRGDNVAVCRCQNLRIAVHSRDIRRADKRHGKRAQLAKGLRGAKAAELSAISIALDGNIHGCKARRAAVHLLGEQNQPCTRAKYRHAVRNALSERFEQIQFAEQLAHDGTLAARQNQPVHRLFQVPLLPNFKMRHTESVQHSGMFGKCAL